MPKFKPQFLLDEQMYLSDAKTSLAYQIREELKETNRLLRKLVEKDAVEDQVAPEQKLIEPESPQDNPKSKLDKKEKKQK
jgi:hypothetical protein